MFVVGIDGGGTKTRVTVCASDGTLLHRETLGAFNLSAIGEDGFRRRVGEILTLCGDMRACGALCVGGAGASGAAMGEILRAELAAHGFAGKLLLCGDHEIALRGAHIMQILLGIGFNLAFVAYFFSFRAAAQEA